MADEWSHLTVTESDSVKIVRFAERKILEELSIAEIGEELYGLVEGQPGVQLVLSFKDVEHLSSAALGVLITLNKRVAELEGTLKLSDISPQIFEVFKITRLSKLFDIYDTLDQALQAF